MPPANIDFRNFAAKPNFDRPILLLFGNDAALVEPAARLVVEMLRKSSPDIEVETSGAAEIVSQPARLFDAFSAASLFQTRAALTISDITERHAALLTDFLAALDPGAQAPGRPEQFLLLSSSSLKAKSKLIAAFRAHPMAEVVACYDVSMDRSGIRKALAERGVAQCADDALDALETMSRGLDPVRMNLTLDKLSLLATDGAALSKADVDASGEGASIQLESDLAILLLSGDRAGLMALYADRAAQSGETSGFLASLGRSLSSLLGAQIAKKTGRNTGRPVFWKVDKALASAAARMPDLAQRLERAVLDIHQLERRCRSGGALEEVEVERLLLRLSSLYAARQRGAP